MSAEIFILSGARAGERIVLDTTEFRVGGAANCEVFFDPRHDLAAKGRSALFRLMDDGWTVGSTGIGDLVVNQTVVSGRMRIRSGDVLRMSDDGPAFSFSILSRAPAAAAHVAAAPAATAVPTAMPGSRPAARNPLPAANVAPATIAPKATQQTERQWSATPVPVPKPAPAPAAVQAPATPASVEMPASPISVSTGIRRPLLWASAIGGGVAIVLLACLATYQFTRGSPTTTTTTSSSGSGHETHHWSPGPGIVPRPPKFH